MGKLPNTPLFDQVFKELDNFIMGLFASHQSGEIKTWRDLEVRVNNFFTREMIEKTDAKVPGWKNMSADADHRTLVHIMCALLGLYLMPEYGLLTPEERNMAKWIVLLHDVGKVTAEGRGDYLHAMQSAEIAANSLPKIGFSTDEKYNLFIDEWSNNLLSAKIENPDRPGEFMPDNRKIGEILAGTDDLFGKNSPASIIIKGVLLHQCIDTVKDWPQTAPLSDDQIIQNIDESLLPLLRVMHLADNEGWTLFEPEREQYRSETLEAFERVERMISRSNQTGE